MYKTECVFVLKPEKIISKYYDDMDYTDFTNGETRLQRHNIDKKEIAKYNKVRNNAQKIIDILTDDEKAQTDIRNENW
jgi:acetyl-CoA carboxylase beta subunit